MHFCEIIDIQNTARFNFRCLPLVFNGGEDIVSFLDSTRLYNGEWGRSFQSAFDNIDIEFRQRFVIAGVSTSHLLTKKKINDMRHTKVTNVRKNQIFGRA